MKGASMDAVGLVWDAHHTFVAGKEQPSVTWAALKPWVRHTHLKDSRPEGNEVRYVLTGKGTVPVREQVRILKAAGYKGYYGFEWEKGWHAGDRGAGGRVPALRRDDSSLPELRLDRGPPVRGSGKTAGPRRLAD